MNITAMMTQVVRQPTLSSSHWVNGRKNTPPMPSPLTARARARPLFRSNHFATGTEVIMFCGAARPVMPRRPNTAMTCQGEFARLIASRAMPIMVAGHGDQDAGAVTVDEASHDEAGNPGGHPAGGDRPTQKTAAHAQLAAHRNHEQSKTQIPGGHGREVDQPHDRDYYSAVKDPIGT